MGIRFLPRTKLGKWSVFLFAFFILSWIVPLASPSDNGVAPGYFAEDPSFLTMLSAVFSGLGILSVMAGFVTGLLAILWKKDWSVLVFLVMLLSLLFSSLILIFLSEGLVV